MSEWGFRVGCQVQACSESFDTVAVIDFDDGDRLGVRLCRKHGDWIKAGPCALRPVSGEGDSAVYEMERRAGCK